MPSPAQEIPRRPCAPPPGHEPGVAVQVNRVGRIADCAEDGALAFVRIRKHFKRLIGVRCDHDMIIGLAAAMAVGDDDTACLALDGSDRTTETDVMSKRSGQFLDVGSAAALDGSPDRPVVLQEAGISKE